MKQYTAYIKGVAYKFEYLHTEADHKTIYINYESDVINNRFYVVQIETETNNIIDVYIGEYTADKDPQDYECEWFLLNDITTKKERDLLYTIADFIITDHRNKKAE